jgi:4-amino-4-deoxy-L-arabinose transferase-like glycosyltransferase
LIPYAPPGFPILIGVSYLAFGISDTAAILVSQIAGVATIPVIGWLGRRIFGAGAGAAAAILCVGSGAHLALSRMALTDSLFLFCFVLALGLGIRFLEKSTLPRAIEFGLAVGLAMNVKYNGAFPGLIVSVVGVLGLLVRGREVTRWEWLRLGGGLLLAGLIAVACYYPWFAFVGSQPGGYAGLVAHHRGYVQGPGAWVRNFGLQLDQATALSGAIPLSGNSPRQVGAFSAAGPTFACAGVGAFLALGPGRPRQRYGRFGVRPLVGILAVSLLVMICPSLWWWLTLAVIFGHHGQHTIGTLTVVATFVLLTALTPLYHPYSRLWLPVTGMSWLLVGGGLARFLTAQRADVQEGPASRLPVLLGTRMVQVLILGVGFVFMFGNGKSSIPLPRVGILAASDSLRKVVGALSEQEAVASRRRLRAAVRPPVLFYLALREVPFGRESGLDALVTGRSTPGEMALADLCLPGVEAKEWRDALDHAWDEIFYANSYELTIPTLLDHDPGIARRLGGGLLPSLNLYIARP